MILNHWDASNFTGLGKRCGQNTIAEARTDCVDRLEWDVLRRIDDDIDRELVAAL